MNPVPDFEAEMTSTRKTLERVRTDKLSFKPHEKSATMAWMATHIAMLPGWGATALTTSELVLDNSAPPPIPETAEAILATFDKNVEEFRSHLAQATDAQLGEQWKCLLNGRVIIQSTRAEVLRNVVLNHMIHHRAQLTMYFRMCGIPVPSLYGPSADEQPGGVSSAG